MALRNKSCKLLSKTPIDFSKFSWASLEKWLQCLAEDKLPEMCVFFKTLMKCFDFSLLKLRFSISLPGLPSETKKKLHHCWN